MGEIKRLPVSCRQPSGCRDNLDSLFLGSGGKTEKYHLEMLICFVYYEIGLWCNVFIYDEIGAYLGMNVSIASYYRTVRIGGFFADYIEGGN